MEPLGQARAGIWIHNRKNGRVAHGHYVGRPGVLGNPWEIGKDGTRLEVIARYRDWLREQYRLHGPARRALYTLAKEYTQTGRLDLVCACAPKACHAEVVRDAVLGIVRRAKAVSGSWSLVPGSQPETSNQRPETSPETCLEWIPGQGYVDIPSDPRDHFTNLPSGTGFTYYPAR